jgi:ferric-dicitrate binding protein FerR (iron transport regulator)
VSLADHEQLEVHALCDALVDGVITDAQRARLEHWLATSEDARRSYVRAMALSASLMDYAGEMQAEAPDAPLESARVVRPAAWVWLAGSLAAAAAVVLAFWIDPNPQDSKTDEIASATQDGDEAVARLSGAKDSRWIGTPLQTGEELHRGQRLELAGGLAEITFDSGAQVTLEGPASIDLNSAWEAVLHRGTLKASIPPEAVGFRVANASVNVVDLGTEFSMIADDSGATEVFVLKGAVEAAGRDAAGNEAQPMVLREKQARRFARVGGPEVRDHDAKLAKLARKVVFERVARPVKYTHWSFDGAGADFAAAEGDDPAAHFQSLTDSTLENAQAAGYRRNGLHFDGQFSAKAVFPGIRQRAARTVAFWINVPSDAPLSDAGAMVSWPVGGAGRSVTVGWNRNPTQGPLGVLRTDTGRGYFAGSTPLRDGRWHHIAVVFSPRVKADKGEGGMQLRQYVDGRLEIAAAKHFGKRIKDAETLAAPTGDALWIGRAMERAGSEQFHGTLDELFVADAALTPREILHLLRENKPATPEMLAAQ